MHSADRAFIAETTAKMLLEVKAVLFFEDKQGRGYIVGTVVLYLSGDLRTLVGRSTYYDHTKKQVVSTSREYRRMKSAG